MAEFNFNPDATPDENIELFLKHLEEVEPGLAALIRANMNHLLPLPDGGPQRSEARKTFNAAVTAALDGVASKEAKK